MTPLLPGDFAGVDDGRFTASVGEAVFGDPRSRAPPNRLGWAVGADDLVPLGAAPMGAAEDGLKGFDFGSDGKVDFTWPAESFDSSFEVGSKVFEKSALAC